MKYLVSIEDLVLMGCDEQDCVDWFNVRGKKKLTTRGLKTIIKEGEKIGWPLNGIVKKMAEKEWVGFEAAWVPEAREPEVIPANWQPSEVVYLALEDKGIPRSFSQSVVGEFVIYWREREELLTTGGGVNSLLGFPCCGKIRRLEIQQKARTPWAS